MTGSRSPAGLTQRMARCGRCGPSTTTPGGWHATCPPTTRGATSTGIPSAAATPPRALKTCSAGSKKRGGYAMHGLSSGQSSTRSNVRCKARGRDLADLETKRPELAANLVLIVAQLINEELPAPQQRAEALAFDRFQVHGLELARADEWWQRANIVTVGLVHAHRRNRGLRISHLDADDRIRRRTTRCGSV